MSRRVHYPGLWCLLWHRPFWSAGINPAIGRVATHCRLCLTFWASNGDDG